MPKKLNYGEQTQIINQIENNFNISSLNYKDINIWPFLKVQILSHKITFEKQEQPKSTTSTVAQDINALNNHKNSLLSTLNLCDKTIEVNTDNNIIFLADATYRYEKVEDKAFHRFADSLSHYLKAEYSTITFEYTTSKYHDNIYTQNNHYYIDNIIQLSKVENSLDLLKDNIFGIPFEVPPNIKKFEAYLNQAHGIYFTRQLSSMLKEFNFILRLKKNFLLLFQYIMPKLIFVTRYWTPVEMALILAAKEINIPSIDIQHGLISHEHLYYAHWDNIPKDGYMLLPKYFWVWDDYTSELMLQWFKTNSHIVQKTGHIWLSFYKDYIYKAENRKKLQTKNNVLFTLQPVKNCFPENIIELIRKTKQKVNWFIRLHPSHPIMKKFEEEIFEILNQLKQEGISIEWENSSRIGLYKLFEDIDIHISIYSSTAYEAYEFGILPVLVSPDAYLCQQYAIDNNICLWETDKEKLIELLTKKHPERPIQTKLYQDKKYLLQILNKLNKRVKYV